MNQKFIPASVLFDEWRKAPEYMKAYNALEEFARAQMVIGARTTPTLAKPNSPSAWAPAKVPCPAGKRPREALDTDAGEIGGGNGDAAADCVGAGWVGS